VSLAFSADGSEVIGQGGSPEWVIDYWAWEKSATPLTSTKSSPGVANFITQVSFKHGDASQLSVSGAGVFRLYRFTDNALRQKAFHKFDDITVHAHAWLSEDTVIVGTDNAKLLLLDGGVLVNEFSITSDKLQHIHSLPVSAILPFSRGFICVIGDSVHVFEKNESNQYRKQVQDICSNAIKRTRTWCLYLRGLLGSPDMRGCLMCCMFVCVGVRAAGGDVAAGLQD
jgi:cilia- and flagella-associated protein 57